MKKRTLSIIAGISYLVIFFAAIFGNFLVVDSLKANPLETVVNSQFLVRLGAVAFLVAAVFDVVIAWALKLMYDKNPLTGLSTYFRLIHAAVMAIAVFALVEVANLRSAEAIIHLVTRFDIIWLIGLFFFGFHLILVSWIVRKPKWIMAFLFAAGVMYIVDTTAHFMLPNYSDYADIFLAMVAVPSILGEMAFGIWLLVKGGKK